MTLRQGTEKPPALAVGSRHHHCLAAMTDDPAHWLAEAVDHHWSTRELQAAIRRSKDTYSEAFERKAMEQRMGHLRDEYNARWGTERECSVVFRPVVVSATTAVG